MKYIEVDAANSELIALSRLSIGERLCVRLRLLSDNSIAVSLLPPILPIRSIRSFDCRLSRIIRSRGRCDERQFLSATRVNSADAFLLFLF